MQPQVTAQIARTTLTLLAIVTSVLLLAVVVLVLCVGLGINPFRETTTEFLIAAFVGLIGVAAVLVLLNVATNLSLIAGSRIAELPAGTQRGLFQKWAVLFAGAAVALVALVTGGTYLSKQRYLSVVQSQAHEVLSTNKALLEEVGVSLASGQYNDYKRISEIRSFLENQRAGLPQLTLIYSGNFEGKLAFYTVQGYFPNDPQYKTYTPSYFPCTQNIDCEYLRTFFGGSDVHDLEKYTFRDDQFYIYVPYVGEKARFVLLFSRTNSYGKLGS